MADQDYILLDTDVYSYLTKSGDTRGHLYQPHVKGKTICLCFITVGELIFGAKKKGWGPAKIEDAKQKLRAVVIVPYDYEMCAKYGELKATLQARGINVDTHDLWIAACALRHSIPLVSNNRRHFDVIVEFGLELISEAPIIAEIEAQDELFPIADKAKAAAASPNEPAPPSSQSPSSSEDLG